MKVIIATLIFISAAEAIRNLVGLPDARSSRLHQLLKDGPIDAQKLANPYSSKTTTARIAALFKNRPLNDHESGSGEESTPPPPPPPEPNPGPAQGPDPALKTLAESILHIGPALKELKETRDKNSQDKAVELIIAVFSKDEDEVKKLLGKHVIEQHQHCDSIKKKYAKYVHESVLDELLEGKDDVLDFANDLREVFEYAKMSSEVDVFEAFSHLVELHDLQDHPGIKAIMMIGGLIADAACDEKLDGLFKILGELVELVDPHGEYDLSDRFNLAIYSEHSPVCRPGYFHIHHHEPKSNIRDKVLDLINRPDCKEVNFMRYIVDTVVEGIEVAHKFAWVHAIAKGYEHAVIKHVTYFMQHGHQDLAYKIVGEYMLANVRGAVTVGLAVEKRFAPKPTGSKPTGSRPITTSAPESTTTPQMTTEASESTTVPQTTTEASESTTAPQTTTEASESTTAPQTTTEAAESTTAPQMTTEASESTTAPQTTTEASESTSAPQTTTEASESTTVPQTTTEASESTTAPQTTTEAAESTTAPQTTTEASESTTAPQTTTEASESTTAPQMTTEASESTTAPQTTTEASESTTAAPVIQEKRLLRHQNRRVHPR